MMRLTSLVPSLALLVLSACAAGSGSDTEPGFTDVQGAGGSDAAGGSGGSTPAGAGGASGKGGQGGSSGGQGGSSGGQAGSGAGAAGASAGSAGASAGQGGASGGAAGTSGGASGAGAAGSGAGTAGSGAGTAGTSAGTAGTSAGTAGQGGKGGSAGAGGGAGTSLDCKDPEPEPGNGSELFATPACSPAPCTIDDEDSTGSVGYKGSHPSLSGIVGPGDVDFYKFHGEDKTHINPTVTTNPSAKTSDGGLRICIYTACETETKDFKCTSSGATVVTSQNGLKGCCLEGPGEVSSDHDCAGSVTDDDSADVFIEIGALDEVCTPYTVDFHF